MLLFIPRSLCALKRVAAKSEHVRYGATQGIRITLAAPGLYRAETTDGHRAMIMQSHPHRSPAVAWLQGAARRRLRGRHPAQGPGADLQGRRGLLAEPVPEHHPGHPQEA